MTAFRNGLFCAAAVAGLTGCTSGFSEVREAVAAAPEWYDERAAEVRGEGYPSIGNIPVLTEQQRTQRNLSVGRDEVAAAERLFAMNPRSVPAGLELDEMLEWAAAAKAEADLKANAPFIHFTDEDLERLRALFNLPRARTS